MASFATSNEQLVSRTAWIPLFESGFPDWLSPLNKQIGSSRSSQQIAETKHVKVKPCQLNLAVGACWCLSYHCLLTILQWSATWEHLSWEIQKFLRKNIRKCTAYGHFPGEKSVSYHLELLAGQEVSKGPKRSPLSGWLLQCTPDQASLPTSIRIDARHAMPLIGLHWHIWWTNLDVNTTCSSVDISWLHTAIVAYH